MEMRNEKGNEKRRRKIVQKNAEQFVKDLEIYLQKLSTSQ